LDLDRFIKYYFLRLIRIKGEPYELALGMALGVFSAMLPILPFHIALAVALALVFRVSKITAAIGVWVSNPFTWYLLYFYNYKIGTFVLGLSGDERSFFSIMGSIKESGETLETILRIAHASWTIIAAFVIGGLIMGVVAAVPSYFILLKIFNLLGDWRQRKRERKSRQKWNQ
jgi:uncharacterized protein (DUF2062 family)